jgi:serine/threonine-protein kinase HipA
MEERKCLYCYQLLNSNESGDFHNLCSKAFFGVESPPLLEYTIQEMSELAKQVVERSIAVPGVQPKISLSVVSNAIDKEKNDRLTIVGALDGNFILKPPTEQYPELPANEAVTMSIAKAFGIEVVPFSLIRLKSGELAYVTKRIDRTKDGDKFHMLDMFQITEAFDKYKSSMEKVGKAVLQYSGNTLLDAMSLFELTVFSFITGNNDMHLKNFSMINYESDQWVLAPAYDLLNVAIANPEDNEELALTLDGKKRKLKLDYFVRWGQQMGLNKKQIEGVFTSILDKRKIALHWINNSFLSEKMKEDYIVLMKERLSRFSK